MTKKPAPSDSASSSPQAAAGNLAPAAATRLTGNERILADRLGEIDELIDPHARLLIDEEEKIRKTLRKFCENEPAGEPVIIFGNRYEVIIGPCGNETKITSMLEVLRALRRAKLASSEWVTIAIGALKLALPDRWEKLTHQAQTGPRRKIVVAPLTQDARKAA